MGRPSYGNSLLKLARHLSGLENLYEELAVLDKYYTAPRYADAWAEGSPYEYYTEQEAVDAVERAKKVLEEVEVVAKRREEQRRRIEAARRFAARVRGKLAPATAVVIGSTVRGDFNAWSDIDVVLVSDRFPENPLRRFDMLLHALEPGIEPIPLMKSRPAEAGGEGGSHSRGDSKGHSALRRPRSPRRAETTTTQG